MDEEQQRPVANLAVQDILGLQDGLRLLLDRIESVQQGHEKLTGEKKFLEDYIGNLMVCRYLL